LDATVAFPDEGTCKKDPNCSDLKLRNPYGSLIRIEAETSLQGEKQRVTLRILGTETKPDVQVRWVQYQTSPFKKRVRKTGKFLGQYKKRVQTGSEGVNGALILQGGRNPRRILSQYAPVDEIWEVGLNFDFAIGLPWESLDEM
jgi:hypothetical protein